MVDFQLPKKDGLKLFFIDRLCWKDFLLLDFKHKTLILAVTENDIVDWLSTLP